MRWVFCAFDVCFKNKYSAAFFGNGKALPLHRGGGIDQPEMDAAVRKISKGDWVHIFPEGRVTQKGGVMGPMRAGVGRMVLESSPRPWIVPIFHLGMQEVRPLNKGPQVGKTVQVIIGDPFSVDDIIEHHAKLGSPRYALVLLCAPSVYADVRGVRVRRDLCSMTVYKAIARRCGVELEKLHVELVARLRENEAAARGGDDVDDEEGDDDDSGASGASAAATDAASSSSSSGSSTNGSASKPAAGDSASKAPAAAIQSAGGSNGAGGAGGNGSSSTPGSAPGSTPGSSSPTSSSSAGTPSKSAS